jgi:aryl-alcohol dehydrogenase-like predicted oxidoreductase
MSAALALGTVQFGMKYGIAGRGEAVPATEVKDILALAWEGGVRALDTASAYGDIEERLASLVGGRSYKVISKIPALPPVADVASAVAFVRDSVVRIRARLGELLDTILFHRSEDLAGPFGEAIWEAAQQTVDVSCVRLGASCYAPADIVTLGQRFPIDVVQVPGNALDQRLHACPLDGREVHLRSVFLQGLLLLSPEEAAARVPNAALAIAKWHAWCRERAVAPLRAALSVAKGLPGVRYCVVGVDRATHLAEVLTAWNNAEPVQAPSLAADDTRVIDPRRWQFVGQG